MFPNYSRVEKWAGEIWNSWINIANDFFEMDSLDSSSLIRNSIYRLNIHLSNWCLLFQVANYKTTDNYSSIICMALFLDFLYIF